MPTDFKEISELKIYKSSDFAGILKRSNHGSELRFDRSFIEKTNVSYFSYCIRKKTEPIVTSGDNLPPFFAGLLPEGRRLTSLVRKLKTSEDDLFSLFAAVGADCIGDINAGENELSLKNEIPKLRDVDFYQLFDEIIDSDSCIIENTSLAGVQEKISASMISFPLNIAKKNKAYILKLNPLDKKNLVQNELCCLELAKKCGFTVGNAKIITDVNQNQGLLVERFDRINNKRLHQEDACQFLNLYPSEKYRISINQIAEAMLKITNAPQIEILNLLRQYVFSYLICNGDMHAKNISLQTLEDGTITLTPLYDLICTAIYSDFKMAIKIDGRNDNIKRKTIVGFAERFDISAKAVNSALDKLLEKFNKNYESLFNISLLDDKKKRLLQDLIIKRIDDFK